MLAGTLASQRVDLMNCRFSVSQTITDLSSEQETQMDESSFVLQKTTPFTLFVCLLKLPKNVRVFKSSRKMVFLPPYANTPFALMSLTFDEYQLAELGYNANQLLQ